MDKYYIHLNKKLDKLQNLKQPQLRTTHNASQQQHFLPRVKNLTNIKLGKEEIGLIKHGRKYRLEKSLKTYITNLTVETKRAIKILDTKIQDSYRILAAKKN
jgi:hypothetical protein